jgi:hypothetical protein
MTFKKDWDDAMQTVFPYIQGRSAFDEEQREHGCIHAASRLPPQDLLHLLASADQRHGGQKAPEQQ